MACNNGENKLLFFCGLSILLLLAFSTVVKTANPLEGLEYYPPTSSTRQSNTGESTQQSLQVVRIVDGVSFNSINRRQIASIPCIGEGQTKKLLFKTNAPNECVKIETQNARCSNGKAEVLFAYDPFCEVCGRYYYDFSFPSEYGVFRVETNIDCNVELLYVTSTKLRQSANFKKTLKRHMDALAEEGLKTKFLVLDKPAVAVAYGTKSFNEFSGRVEDWVKYKLILDKVMAVTKPKYVLILGGLDVFPMAVFKSRTTVTRLNKETCQNEVTQEISIEHSDEFY
ncbi:MAG: hypothetical protein QW343_02645, partial [Candidatus Norongarragalinales archaeon]